MTDYVKYARTFHLPWSLGVSSDDKVLKSIAHLEAMDDVVVTEKVDGECTSCYADHTHAKSIDSKGHWSRDRLKSWWASTIAPYLASDSSIHRICGENMCAVHSIEYDGMADYFYAFNAWDQNNMSLAYDDFIVLCDVIGIQRTPVLYRGPWDEKIIRSLYPKPSKLGGEMEGYVVANAKSFHYDDFKSNVAKFVRKDHVTTDEHWMFQAPKENKLKS